MATYKVIQDIEAEDKFVGPLTLKQFVFAAIGTVFAYLCFFVIARNLWFVALAFAPVSLFGFFMAIPWSKEQPTDVWVLAKIRFRIKPKKRIWDQAGYQELVTITAPNTEEKILTKELSETEVKSRLKALSDTMDTRGWAIKHAALPNTYSQTGQSASRLIPTPIPVGSNPAIDEGIPDILEEAEIDQLIDKKERDYKASLVQNLSSAGGEPIRTKQPFKVAPSTGDDVELARKLKEKKQESDLYRGSMHQLKSAGKRKDGGKKLKKTEAKKATGPVTQQISPDILNLAHNNDLNVATLARQAKKDEDDSEEVVVSLH